MQVSHPDHGVSPMAGFRFMWAYYVSGFRPETHCQPCFRGKRVPDFCTGTARSGVAYEFSEFSRYRYLYLCGVGEGPERFRKERNFHLPIEYSEGGLIERTTYNGYVFRLENAAELPIPELPDGWNGRNQRTTRCKNFRFAVAYFGYPSEG